MATASGEAPARRRKGRGRKEPSTPAEIGTALLRARQALGLGLLDVRDRTGVPLAVLEALEVGDLSQVPNHDAAFIGLRRYADLVQLDSEALTRALDRAMPARALVGAAAAPAQVTPGVAPAAPATAGGGGPATGGGFAGHLRRYPGDGMHLQAFTQTAQVPSVGSTQAPGAWSAGGYDPYGSGQVFGTTGMYPATPPLRIRQVVRPAAWPVRVLVWLTAGALVVAGLGLVVAHAKPSWMRTLHLARVPHAASAPGMSSTRSGQGTGHHAPSPGSSVVTTGVPGPTGTTITVRADQYTVLLSTLAPCWVLATTPNASVPVLNATLPPGTKQVLTPVGGQLTVELGASGVALVVQVKGKTVPGWTFIPTSAPVTLVFTNTTTSTP